MEKEMAKEQRRVRIRFSDSEGVPAGRVIDLPLSSSPSDLQKRLKRFLNHEDKNFAYAFYLSDRQIADALGSFLESGLVMADENVLQIVFRREAAFQTSPISRILKIPFAYSDPSRKKAAAGHSFSIYSLAFSPEGKYLACGTSNNTVQLWNVVEHTLRHTCKGHQRQVTCVQWSADGSLVSGSSRGDLRFWDTESGKQTGKTLQKHTGDITGISWEPVHLRAPCRRFASASKDKKVYIWDISLGTSICLNDHTRSVTCVVWGGEGLIYTGSLDSLIKVWETTTWKPIKSLGHSFKVTSLSLSTGYVLQTGAYNGHDRDFTSAEQMREAALERYRQLKGNAPERVVSAVDRKLILWEHRHPNEYRKTVMEGHGQVVCQVVFSPDGQWIASGSRDMSVKIWNGRTGHLVTTLEGHERCVQRLCWSPDSRYVLSGARDGKVWDIRRQRQLHHLLALDGEVRAMDWSPNGKEAVSGGKLLVWMDSEA